MTYQPQNPAVRTVVSPSLGVLSVHAYEGGFEAVPLDHSVMLTYGLLAIYAGDVETLVQKVREW